VKRRLFNILAAVSLLLGVATIALRVRALWYVDRVGRSDFWRGELYFTSDSGLLYIKISDQVNYSPLAWHSSPLPDRSRGHSPSRKDSWLKRLGFRYEKWSGQEMRHSGGKINPLVFHEVYANVPLWFIACLFAIGPAIWLRPHLRARLHLPGHCVKCAYNLTGNVSGICPECGTAVAPRSPEAEGASA